MILLRPLMPASLSLWMVNGSVVLSVKLSPYSRMDEMSGAH